MLAQQEPYPAFVVDRRWNLLRANGGGGRLVEFLTDTPPAAPDPAQPINLADALVAPDALRPLIVNWREVALYFLRGVQADALADGTAETAALLERLLAYPDVPAHLATRRRSTRRSAGAGHPFPQGRDVARALHHLATLGTPQDVTLQEIRIECFFPADAASAEVFKHWPETGSARDGVRPLALAIASCPRSSGKGSDPTWQQGVSPLWSIR